MRLLLALVLLAAAPAAAAGPDPKRHFDEANALKDGDACDEAVLRYEEFLVAAPDSEFAPTARYNQAVCFEDLGLAAAALEAHTAVVEDFSAPPELRADARFRIARIHTVLDENDEARRALGALAASVKSSPDAEVIQVHLAWLDAQAGLPRAAAKRLAKAVPVLEAAHAEDERAGLDVHLALASLTMGDLVGRRALEVKLKGDYERVQEALARAADAAGAAESYYVDALERRNPAWGAAATLHLGTLYVEFHALLSSYREGLGDDKPKGWTPGQTRAMEAWLGDRLDPLLLKARQALKICVDIAAQAGESNRFTKACDEALGLPPF